MFARRKPLLAVVGGRSASGRRAGLSHTAGAAAPAVGVEALFARAGVIGCRALDELADAARLVTTQPLPAGPRLAVIGNAGGLGVLAADAAAEVGLTVPELPPEARRRLPQESTGAAGLSNPVDLGAGTSAESLLAATRVALEQEGVDAVLVIVAGTKVTAAADLVAGLERHRAAHGSKPLLLVTVGDVPVPAESRGFTRFASVEDATRALAHAVAYATWRSGPAASEETIPGGDGRPARALAARWLAEAVTRDGWVSPAAARRLLGLQDIEVLEGRVEQGLPRLLATAHQLGYPVVLKAADPAIVHKTDSGLVRTGLSGPSDIIDAAQDLSLRLGSETPELLVQAEATPGVEVAVGLVRDAGFGPLVMVAAGGVATDVWDDRIFLMPPFSVAEATRALRRLRVWRLLSGFRGSPPTDVAALAALVEEVGRLAHDVPEVAELDLNPVIVSPSGVAVVDVKLRLSTADTLLVDDGVPRGLRRPT
jgi:acyl-CoA synthetase (NDP forming)